MSIKKEQNIKKDQDGAKGEVKDISADSKNRTNDEVNEDRDIGQTDVKLKPIDIEKKDET